MIQLCTRMFPDGHTCGSPALRGERLCYYHHPARNPADPYARRARRGFTLQAPRTRKEYQSALSDVIQRLAANKLDTKRAGLLICSLQMAARDLFA